MLQLFVKVILVMAALSTTACTTRMASVTDRFHRAQQRGYLGYSQAEEGQWQGDFVFLQLADCQLGMMEEDRSWEEELRQLEQAVDYINQSRPRFVIVCGDLVNAEPDKEQHPAQVADFKRVTSGIDDDIPLVCLCGNHDVGNAPTAESIASYESDFGDHYFSFWVGGMHALVLNSSLYYDPSNAEDMLGEQQAWLEAELQRGDPVHRVVFTHHPWFLESAQEDDHYFAIPQERRLPLLKLLYDAGVRYCFAGHYHRNAYGQYKELSMITTSAVGMPLGEDAPGMRVVRVCRDRLEHKFVELQELGLQAQN